MNHIRLGEVISSAKVNRCGENDYPILSITKSDGLVLQSDKFKKRIASNDTDQYKIVKKGQLVQGIHIDEANFGVQNLVDEGIVSPAYKIWDIDSGKIVPEYLEFVLRSPRSLQYYASKFNGSIKRRERITDNDFLSMMIPLPSIVEQHNAVNIILTIKTLLTLRQEEKNKHDDLIKARFVEMFGDSASNGVPLKECCQDICGGGTPSMQHPEYYGGDVPFIKSGDVRGDTVSSGTLWLTEKALTETTAKYVSQGAILVVNRSAALLREFRAAIAIRPVVINQDIKAFIPKTSFTSEYLLWAIKIQSQFLLTKVTTVLTSHIDLKDLLELQIPSASIERQKAFSKFVSQVDKSKVAVQKALEQTQLLFNSLMQQYFG